MSDPIEDKSMKLAMELGYMRGILDAVAAIKGAGSIYEAQARVLELPYKDPPK